MNNNQEITAYNESQTAAYQPICELLFREINKQFSQAESKIWHRHPIWFLEGNPIVGCSIEKRGVRLMFWNGQSFDEENLIKRKGEFVRLK